MNVVKYIFVFVSVFCLTGVLLTFTSQDVKSNAQNPSKYGSLISVWNSGRKERPLSIRLLVFRHTPEQMAVGDANLAIRAVNKAQSKGLDIKVIGNHLVRNLNDVKVKLKQDIEKEARRGDTLIVHTIGHGFPDGGLQNLGQRREVMRVFVNQAHQHRQEMLWWQLSCYAAARLPKITQLSQNRQSLFSNLASSTSQRPSPAGVQGRIMQQLFVTLAENPDQIDINEDDIVTANELKSFLNSLDSSNRGNLLFARSGSEPIFGVFRPWELPIVDRRNPQREFEPDFIPIPSF